MQKASFICPKCQKLEIHRVLETRTFPEYIRRRIEFKCGERVTTYERLLHK